MYILNNFGSKNTFSNFFDARICRVEFNSRENIVDPLWCELYLVSSTLSNFRLQIRIAVILSGKAFLPQQTVPDCLFGIV